MSEESLLPQKMTSVTELNTPVVVDTGSPGSPANSKLFSCNPEADTILPQMQDVVHMLASVRQEHPHTFDDYQFRMQCFEWRGLVTNFFVEHVNGKGMLSWRGIKTMWTQYRKLPDLRMTLQACKLAAAWFEEVDASVRDLDQTRNASVEVLDQTRNAYWAQWARTDNSNMAPALYKMWQVLFLFFYLEHHGTMPCKEFCQPPPKDAFNHMGWHINDQVIFFTKGEVEQVDVDITASKFTLPIHPDYFRNNFPLVWCALTRAELSLSQPRDGGYSNHVKQGFKMFTSTLVAVLEERLATLRTYEAKALAFMATAFLTGVKYSTAMTPDENE